MTTIRRIVVTGDLLRPFPDGRGGFESGTTKNIRWLRHLLDWQLEVVTGLPRTSVAWAPGGGFDSRDIYRRLDRPVSLESWAALFYRGEFPEAVEEALAAPFHDALVVGVELPDYLQGVLSRRGVPFVDLVAHPVRFHDDILLALRTNHPGVHDALRRRRFDIERCRATANLIRAKCAWMPGPELPDGTALVTGQVATDKAVIDRTTGRFLDLGHFVENLFELCERHPLVLYKPHPYQGDDCPSLRVIRSFGAIRIVRDNFYALVGRDAVTHVAAMSSGTVHEATLFGKVGTPFAGPLYDFGATPPAGVAPGAAQPIGDDLLDPGFWADILRPVVAVADTVPAGPGARASRLRRSLNADWDHGFIDAVVQPAAPRPALTPLRAAA
jgi:hypothetical protein